MLVIGVTGMRGSGKSMFSEVAKKLKIPHFEMRDIVYDMMKRKGLGLTNKSVREFATKLRERYGFGVVAKKLIEKLKGLNNEVILINGIRGLEEVDVFRKKYGNGFTLVAVYASPKTRFKRVLRRNKPDDPKTWRDFEWADKKELGWGVAEAMVMADKVEVNEGKRSDFGKRAFRVLTSAK